MYCLGQSFVLSNSHRPPNSGIPPQNSGILVCDITDHFPILTSFPFVPSTNSTPSNYSRKYSTDNIRNWRIWLLFWDQMILMCLLVISSTFFTIFMKKTSLSLNWNVPTENPNPGLSGLPPVFSFIVNSSVSLLMWIVFILQSTTILSRRFYILLNKLIFPSNLRRRKITSEIPGSLLTVSLKITLPHTFLVLMLMVTVLTILFSLQNIIMISLSILDPILPMKFRIVIHIFRILLWTLIPTPCFLIQLLSTNFCLLF